MFINKMAYDTDKPSRQSVVISNFAKKYIPDIVKNERHYINTNIIFQIQKCLNTHESALYDERLLLPLEEWKKYLTKTDFNYIKIEIFPTFFSCAFDTYSFGLLDEDEKLDLVKSKLKSMYREQIVLFQLFSENKNK